jgi:hypothetical protein
VLCRIDGKGVKTGTLVKVGVLEAKSSKFSGGAYGQDWTFYSREHLNSIYDQVSSILNDVSNPYRFGDAVTILVGMDGARIIAASQELVLRE